ncbi:hypothetical protein [Mycobacteroides abscessus]|uniref:hypothetical protein n=1 Tax=Mycobacteroides abscessus TaxID=36809 RepID=UPI0005E19C88|nr:hypothetical protein [Mycobacteroides abscessus]CPR69620.1 Uncharacterised protein [Mycobacteroides abscessus]CPU70586.1 Uncharacterised protein [Mycobacteroides abscessus]
MTDKITIKERAAVQARIGELNTHQRSVTTLGTAVSAQITALTSALTATALAGAEPVPGGISTAVKGQFDAAAAKVGATSSKLQSWLDGQTVIDQDGSTGVQQADGSTPKPTDPKPETPKPGTPTPTPQAKPYSTSGGSTGGSSPYPAAE